VTAPTPADLEEAACEAAMAAGDLLRRRFGNRGSLDVRAKGLHDFVTEADREAEAAIVGLLTRRYPDHAVMAEEGSPAAERAAHRWIVDPLDGTTNFIHGVPVFGVSVAVEDPGGLVAGAIHDPLRRETFHARRGGGARLDGAPIRCSDPANLGEALVATGFPFRELSRLAPYLVAFEAFARTTSGIRRAGAACLDLAYTACGRYDGFWEVGLSRWDIAAGALLVREAGGRVTDVGGGDRFLDSGDIVAAGERLHPAMLDVMRRAFGAAADRG
jgi:myo-inositol-1(or 4)-monophosphatase